MKLIMVCNHKKTHYDANEKCRALCQRGSSDITFSDAKETDVSLVSETDNDGWGRLQRAELEVQSYG